LLLRHLALMRKIVLPSLFDRRDGVTDAMVEYVIDYRSTCNVVIHY